MPVKRSATKKSNARSGRLAALPVKKSATKKCVNKKSATKKSNATTKSNATKKSNAKESNATAQKRSATKKSNAAAKPCVNRSGRPVNQARHDGGLKARATQEKTQMMKYEDTNRRFEVVAQVADAVALAMEQASNAGAEVTAARDTAAMALQGKADATSRCEVIRAEVQRLQLELGEAMVEVAKESAISDQARAVLMSKEVVLDEALKYKEALTKKFNAQHAVAMEQASNAGTEVTAAKGTAAMALQGKADATSRYEVMRAEAQRMQLELGEAMVAVAQKSAISDQARAVLMSKEAVFDEALKYKEAMTKKFNEQLQALPSAVPAMFCEQLKERAQLPHDFLSWSHGGM